MAWEQGRPCANMVGQIGLIFGEFSCKCKNRAPVRNGPTGKVVYSRGVILGITQIAEGFSCAHHNSRAELRRATAAQGGGGTPVRRLGQCRFAGTTLQKLMWKKTTRHTAKHARPGGGEWSMELAPDRAQLCTLVTLQARITECVGEGEASILLKSLLRCALYRRELERDSGECDTQECAAHVLEEYRALRSDNADLKFKTMTRGSCTGDDMECESEERTEGCRSRGDEADMSGELSASGVGSIVSVVWVKESAFEVESIRSRMPTGRRTLFFAARNDGAAGREGGEQEAAVTMIAGMNKFKAIGEKGMRALLHRPSFRSCFRVRAIQRKSNGFLVSISELGVSSKHSLVSPHARRGKEVLYEMWRAQGRDPDALYRRLVQHLRDAKRVLLGECIDREWDNSHPCVHADDRVVVLFAVQRSSSLREQWSGESELREYSRAYGFPVHFLRAPDGTGDAPKSSDSAPSTAQNLTEAAWSWDAFDAVVSRVETYAYRDCDGMRSEGVVAEIEDAMGVGVSFRVKVKCPYYQVVRRLRSTVQDVKEKGWASKASGWGGFDSLERLVFSVLYNARQERSILEAFPALDVARYNGDIASTMEDVFRFIEKNAARKITEAELDAALDRGAAPAVAASAHVLLFTTGVPGCGKSSFLQGLVSGLRESGARGRVVHVSRDKILQRVIEQERPRNPKVSASDKMVRQRAHKMQSRIQRAIANESPCPSVVLWDACNATAGAREQLVKELRPGEVIALEFNHISGGVSDAVLLDRIRSRMGHETITSEDSAREAVRVVCGIFESVSDKEVQKWSGQWGAEVASMQVPVAGSTTQVRDSLIARIGRFFESQHRVGDGEFVCVDALSLLDETDAGDHVLKVCGVAPPQLLDTSQLLFWSVDPTPVHMDAWKELCERCVRALVHQFREAPVEERAHWLIENRLKEAQENEQVEYLLQRYRVQSFAMANPHITLVYWNRGKANERGAKDALERIIDGAWERRTVLVEVVSVQADLRALCAIVRVYDDTNQQVPSASPHLHLTLGVVDSVKPVYAGKLCENIRRQKEQTEAALGSPEAVGHDRKRRMIAEGAEKAAAVHVSVVSETEGGQKQTPPTEVAVGSKRSRKAARRDKKRKTGAAPWVEAIVDDCTVHGVVTPHWSDP